MKIVFTNTFERSVKRFHRKEISLIEDAIDIIASDPACGEAKKGDLTGVLVYKFRINKQLLLLAYLHDKKHQEITLLSLGSHENFYRDLKK